MGLYLQPMIMIAMMVALVMMLVYLSSNGARTILHWIFTATILELLIWEAAVLIGGIYSTDPDMFVLIDNFTYFGAAFVPVTLLYLGLAYQSNFNGFTKPQWLFIVPPIVTIVLIFANSYHHLFYLSYSMQTGYVLGPYFYFHAIYSYCCMVIGMILLCYSAAKTSGILSLQAVVIFIGSIIPTITNICYTLKVPGFDVYTTPFALSITVMLFIYSIFKIGLFKVVPVATRTVIDRISDCFVVVDANLGILDYNKSFEKHFLHGTASSDRLELSKAISASGITPAQVQDICDSIEKAISEHEDLSGDLNLSVPETIYYTVEYTPLAEHGQITAVVILFKDVTQHVLDLKALKENQDILLERERLASLGQMIGGIAHNLKSPILAVSGSIEQLQSLIEEYRYSIGDEEVTIEDHHEIAQDMTSWLDKMRTQLSYMSDIISTVKGQAAQFSEDSDQPFTVGDVLKRMQILMQHALTRDNCTLESNILIDPDTIIHGDINSLVQVIDNVIDNAIQSYDGRGGPIRLTVERIDDDVRFAIADDGDCIDLETQQLLFKQMTTTKGKYGTGLGLYMSYSTIKGMFRGNMWFASKPDEETVFYIQIPLAHVAI